MTSLDSWNSMAFALAFTHIWQSTAFAVGVWTLTLAMRDRAARFRFSLWMAASIKFLVPFALLVALGSRWPGTDSRPSPDPRFYAVVQQIEKPFAAVPFQTPDLPITSHGVADWRRISILLLGVWLIGSFLMLARLARQWWVAHSLVKDSSPLEHGREVDVWDRTIVKARIRKPVSIIGIRKGVEPGIFGVRRPVLMWPLGLSQILSDTEIVAIMAHECEHVRRRDNLTVLIQTFVEVFFWFNPMVWLIGEKMIDERERACDERVLEGAEPRTYADCILKVCAFCLESSLPCVAGVSGSELRKRVLRIAKHRSSKPLGVGPRIGFIIAAISAIALPIGFGAVGGQSLPEQKKTQTWQLPAPPVPPSDSELTLPTFEVSTVKPSKGDEPSSTLFTPDSVQIVNIPLISILCTGFRTQLSNIFGAPAWVSKRPFNIEAKVDPEEAAKLASLNLDARRAMLLPLVVERFHLKYHLEKREVTIYSLVVAKGGIKMKEITPAAPGSKEASQPSFLLNMGPGRVESNGTPLAFLALRLSDEVGKTVVDHTGLSGKYAFVLEWTPESNLDSGSAAGESRSQTDPVTTSASSVFTALQEELGLRLEPKKQLGDVVVIDSIEMPTEN